MMKSINKVNLILIKTMYLSSFQEIQKEKLPLQYSWKMRMQENTFDIGCQENIANRIYGSGRHVSATNLNANIAPANLKTALAGNNPDRNT